MTSSQWLLQRKEGHLYFSINCSKLKLTGKCILQRNTSHNDVSSLSTTSNEMISLSQVRLYPMSTWWQKSRESMCSHHRLRITWIKSRYFLIFKSNRSIKFNSLNKLHINLLTNNCVIDYSKLSRFETQINLIINLFVIHEYKIIEIEIFNSYSKMIHYTLNIVSFEFNILNLCVEESFGR